MILYLLRHGLAVDPGTPGRGDDSARSLTPRGERKTRQIAQAMKGMEVVIDRILTSPYLRARQTAEIVAEAYELEERLELCTELAPGGQPRKLIERIGQSAPEAENLLLVGHEPDLSTLASLLSTGLNSSAITLKKGGLCRLDCERLRPGRCATLEWLLTPKQMVLMTASS